MHPPIFKANPLSRFFKPSKMSSPKQSANVQVVDTNVSTVSESFSRLSIAQKPTTASSSATSDENDENAEIRLTKFTLFPNLPAELQLKIWKHAIPNSRLAYLSWDVKRPGRIVLLSLRYCPPYALPRACKASLEVVLKEYKPRIITHCVGTKLRLSGPEDTVFLEYFYDFLCSVTRIAGGPGANLNLCFTGVKSLVIHHTPELCTCPRAADWFAREFQSLEILRVVTNRSYGLYWSTLGSNIKAEVAFRSLYEDGLDTFWWGNLDELRARLRHAYAKLRKPAPEVRLVEEFDKAEHDVIRRGGMRPGADRILRLLASHAAVPE